jgi:hypothetical protein
VLCKNSKLGVYCEARFGDLMFWRVLLICLQGVVEELLWNIWAWFNRVSFFVDFKHIDEGGLRTFKRASLLEERAFLFEKLVLKKIYIFKNSFFFSLGWSPLFIEICRGSQVFFQCHMTWFYWLIFIDKIFHLWQDILNISS